MGAAHIDRLDKGQRLVVMFTITGPADAQQVAKWNAKMDELRQLGIEIVAVTIRPERRESGGSAQ